MYDMIDKFVCCKINEYYFQLKNKIKYKRFLLFKTTFIILMSLIKDDILK